jgi:serine phosphatase RsbU (regulator of sigma subunit)
VEGLDVAHALRSVAGADPTAIPALVASLAGELGATDVVLYLVDFSQTTLVPIGDGKSGQRVRSDVASEEVGTTAAGRCFLEQAPLTLDKGEVCHVWVPVVQGSERTGVLALTLPSCADGAVRACEELGMLAGYLVATHARGTDHYQRCRSRRALSLAASMQWDLLPPLVLRTSRVSLAALVEPAYDIGGDCFDYATDDATLDLAVMDAMGHGVPSALTAALTIGSYRHDRRERLPIEEIHAHLDEAVAAHAVQPAFSTGQIARIDLDTGVMQWTNAGHPLPMLIRGGRVVRELDCPPTLPWGLRHLSRVDVPVTVATEALEPGDSVLFYTDGVVEAESPSGEEFGVDRLADVVGRAASDSLEPESVARLVVRAVLEHQSDLLVDDATLFIVRFGARSG